jgi:hypothetical protein
MLEHGCEGAGKKWGVGRRLLTALGRVAEEKKKGHGGGGVGVGSVPCGGRGRSGEGGHGVVPLGTTQHGRGGSGPLGQQRARREQGKWRVRWLTNGAGRRRAQWPAAVCKRERREQGSGGIRH